MADICPHGLPAAKCLICPRLPQAAAPAGGGQMQTRRGGGLRVVGGLGALVVVGLAVWVVVGVVLSALHVVELIAIGLAAGWVGYRVGFFRGTRRHH